MDEAPNFSGGEGPYLEDFEEEDAVVPGVPGGAGEEEPDFIENSFVSTEKNNVSTLSADVDTASYTYFRKLVNNGYSLEELMRYSASAFRTEEFINYFKYEGTAPTENELFGVRTQLVPAPWNPEGSMLLRMTLKAQTAVPAKGNNLVFLIDVSGSMSSPDKLGLLKQTFGYLVDRLTENDTISIVTYSGNERVVLEGCTGNKKETILSSIQGLQAGGSTYGEAGLRRAYEIAERYFIEGGNNRIIMASDGDLNVGISSAEELEAFVTEKRERGVFLSVLGFGTGNYRDRNMETIADCGNGVYYYIDGESEGERIFGTELFSTLYTVAKDVKMQVTFDSDYVSAWRLIGYENRLLNEDDFTDDTKDAGEVGAGHCVTVCYELTLKEGAKSEEAQWLELAVNYKLPDQDTSVPPNLYSVGYGEFSNMPDADDAFIGCVIELCMLLHESEHLGEDVTLQSIVDQLNALDLSDTPDRAELRALLQKLL